MVRIEQEKCVGCGICANICPEGIEMVNGKAHIKDEKAGCIKEAADACPRGAILMDNSEEHEEPSESEASFNQNFMIGKGSGRGSGRGAGQGRGMGQGKGAGRGHGRNQGSGRGQGRGRW